MKMTEQNTHWVFFIALFIVQSSNHGNSQGLFTPMTHVFFCCGNSAADISKSHTFKWGPLADEVLEAAWGFAISANTQTNKHTNRHGHYNTSPSPYGYGGRGNELNTTLPNTLMSSMLKNIIMHESYYTDYNIKLKRYDFQLILQ